MLLTPRGHRGPPSLEQLIQRHPRLARLRSTSPIVIPLLPLGIMETGGGIEKRIESAEGSERGRSYERTRNACAKERQR